ncbi:MAG: permease prefix domain 1-containing protein [Oscillospiraceae bacterium]|nr:permease prefix domain 1-containing protein [Oscillospiraceae bacterium]
MDMNIKLRQFIDSIFEDAPQTQKTADLKEEIINNLTDKYDELIREGKSEDTAYNLAVASIGDVGELIKSLKNAQHVNSRYIDPEIEKSKHRSALLISVAVCMYILSVIPPILFGLSENINSQLRGVVVMFVMIAGATALIIYNAMTRPKYYKTDDTLVEDFKKYQMNNSNIKQFRNTIISVMWMLIVVIYFIISFAIGAWHLTWLIFIIGAALNQIIKAIFDLR